MSKCTGLGCVLAIGLMSFPSAVFAGAWTLEAGQAVEIVTVSPSRATKGFDGDGKLQSIPRYSKVEAQALFEYGVTERFTFLFAPSLQHVSIGAPIESRRSGLGYTDIGGRMNVAKGDAWVISAQTVFRVPGTFDKSVPAAIGYTDPEIDVRALFGYAFAMGGWPSFIDVQFAQRFRLGGPPDEFRADLTLGIYPRERWLILMQSFNVVSEGKGSWDNPSYSYSKFQLSAVYALTPALSLQLGGYTTYMGRNALQENGLVLSAWYRF